MNDSQRITVIIASWKSGDDLQKAVNSIRRQEEQAKVDILVIDSSHPDERPHVERARIVYSERRLYQGGAMNLGLELSSTPLVAFLDADCEAQPGWLEAHLRGLEAGHQVVTGPVLPMPPANMVSLAESFVHFTDFFLRRRAGSADYLLTGNASCHRSVFDTVGLFREDCRVAEDIDFGQRLTKHGLPAWFEPTAVVFHRNRNRLWPFLRHQWLSGYHLQRARANERVMPYHWLAKLRILPLLTLWYRAAKIISLSVRAGMLGRLVQCAPPLALGLVVRTLGEGWAALGLNSYVERGS